MKRRLLLLAVLCLCPILLAGERGKVGTGERCKADSDCTPGLICLDSAGHGGKVCIVGCRKDSDCTMPYARCLPDRWCKPLRDDCTRECWVPFTRIDGAPGPSAAR